MRTPTGLGLPAASCGGRRSTCSTSPTSRTRSRSSRRLAGSPRSSPSWMRQHEAPLTVKGSMGQQVISPFIAEARAQRALQAQLLGRLGLPDTDEESEAKAERLTRTRRRAAKGGNRRRAGDCASATNPTPLRPPWPITTDGVVTSAHPTRPRYHPPDLRELQGMGSGPVIDTVEVPPDPRRRPRRPKRIIRMTKHYISAPVTPTIGQPEQLGAIHV